MLGPLTLILLLSGLIRHYVTMLLNTPPKSEPMLVIREQCVARPPSPPALLTTHAPTDEHWPVG